jgi:hypothetical protein
MEWRPGRCHPRPDPCALRLRAGHGPPPRGDRGGLTRETLRKRFLDALETGARARCGGRSRDDPLASQPGRRGRRSSVDPASSAAAAARMLDNPPGPGGRLQRRQSARPRRPGSSAAEAIGASPKHSRAPHRPEDQCDRPTRRPPTHACGRARTRPAPTTATGPFTRLQKRGAVCDHLCPGRATALPARRAASPPGALLAGGGTPPSKRPGV